MHMTLLGHPVSAASMAFVEAVADLLLTQEQGQRRDRGKQLPKFKATISAIVIDLLNAAARRVIVPQISGVVVPEALTYGWAYHGRHTEYFRNADHDVSKRLFADCIDDFERAGLLEREKGISFQSKLTGSDGKKYETHKATRYRATDALAKLAEAHGISSGGYRTHFKYDLPRTVIELREPSEWKDQPNGSRKKEKGKRIRLAPTPEVEALSQPIKELNAFLSAVKIEGGLHWAFRRIFNDGDKSKPAFNKGGRLYSSGPDSYQQDSKETRRSITFDGQPTCEIDIRSSFLTLIYGLCRHHCLDEEGYSLGNPHEEDLYSLPDTESRSVGKAWFTIAIGLHSMPVKWSAARVKDYREETGGNLKKYRVAEVAEKMLSKHPVIGYWLSQTDRNSKDLQFIESNIILNTMLRLKRSYGIPALPVHDSLIVKTQDAEVAAGVLKAEFECMADIIPCLSLSKGTSVGFEIDRVRPLRTQEQEALLDAANF